MNTGFLPHGFLYGFSTQHSKEYNADNLCIRLIKSGNPIPDHSCSRADSADLPFPVVILTLHRLRLSLSELCMGVLCGCVRQKRDFPPPEHETLYYMRVGAQIIAFPASLCLPTSISQ